MKALNRINKFRNYFCLATLLTSVVVLSSCSGIREGETIIINTNAYETAVSLYHPITKDSAITQTFIMAPGASVGVKVRFNNVEPKCYIYQEPTLKAMDFLLWLEHGDKLDILEPEADVEYAIKGLSNESHKSVVEVEPALFGQEEDKLWKQMFQKNVYEPNSFPIADNLEKTGQVLLFKNTSIDETQKVKHVVFEKTDFKDIFGRINGKILIKDDFDFTPNSDETSVKKVQNEVLTLLENLNRNYIKKGEFEVINVAPYSVYIALWHQESRSTSINTGWYQIEAGERRTFHKEFKGVIPNFSVYGQSGGNDADVIRHAFNLSRYHPGIKYFQPEAEEVVLKGWVNESDAFYFATVFDDIESHKIAAIEVAFNEPVMGLKDSINKSYSGSFMIQDFDFPFVISNVQTDVDDKEVVLNSYAENAKALAKSLKRQVFYESEFPDFVRDSPYLIGAYINDKDSRQPGVTVEGLMFSQNILGQPMPFRKNDVILELNGELVFSVKDIAIIINRHASDIYKGIAVPITVTLLREGMVYQGDTLYFYNPQYKNWPDNDMLMAFLGGVLDAISLGFDHKIYQKFSGDAEKAYIYIESKFRLQQFHKGFFLAGNLGTSIFSPIGLILKGPIKKFLKKGIGKKLAGVLATTMVEGAENALWTFGNSHVLYSKKEFAQMLRSNVKFGAGFGMAFSSFNLIK